MPNQPTPQRQVSENLPRMTKILEFLLNRYGNKFGLYLYWDQQHFEALIYTIEDELVSDYPEPKRHSPVKWAGYLAAHIHKDKPIDWRRNITKSDEQFKSLKHRINAEIAIDFATLICDGYKDKMTSLMKEDVLVFCPRLPLRNHLRKFLFSTMQNAISSNAPVVINRSSKSPRKLIANDPMAMTLIFEMFLEGRYEPPIIKIDQPDHNI